MVKDLSCIVGMGLVIFPIIFSLFYIFSQGHFAY